MGYIHTMQRSKNEIDLQILRWKRVAICRKILLWVYVHVYTIYLYVSKAKWV